MNGILLVDKPIGMTSQQVVSKIKRVLNVKKIGHAGTLDPQATGVLVVLIEEATKLSDYLLEKDKCYLTEITIGKSTTTLDSEGEIVSSKEVTEKIDIDELLNSIKGKYFQLPPMYSAIKKDGKKLYDLAREGIEVARKEREVNIISISKYGEEKYIDNTLVFSFVVEVSKGTYIRSLCKDLGDKINYPAYMSNLRRLKSGKFNIDDCYTIEDIEKGNYKIISMLSAIDFLETIEINNETLRRALNGREIDNKYLNASTNKIALANENKLIAIYEKKDNYYKALRVWN